MHEPPGAHAGVEGPTGHRGDVVQCYHPDARTVRAHRVSHLRGDLKTAPRGRVTDVDDAGKPSALDRKDCLDQIIDKGRTEDHVVRGLDSGAGGELGCDLIEQCLVPALDAVDFAQAKDQAIFCEARQRLFNCLFLSAVLGGRASGRIVFVSAGAAVKDVIRRKEDRLEPSVDSLADDAECAGHIELP